MNANRSEIAALVGAGVPRLIGARPRIVVVGAGGWLGLATVALLRRLLGESFETMVVCFGSQTRGLTLRDGSRLQQYALPSLCDLPPTPTVVLHLAFLTQEKAVAMTAEAYAAANEAISDTVLGALDVIGAGALFVPSSGAVYRVDDPRASASMRLYGRLKLRDEALFARWAMDRGRRAVISRVFNLAGPYINKVSSYALASFILDVLADRPIVIRADRRVYRSYVAIRELMSIVFAELTLQPSACVTFDTAGDRTLEMTQIAQSVSHALGGRRGIMRPELRDTDPDRYVGDAEAYRRLRSLHRVSPVELRDQIIETARFLAEEPADGGPTA